MIFAIILGLAFVGFWVWLGVTRKKDIQTLVNAGIYEIRDGRPVRVGRRHV